MALTITFTNDIPIELEGKSTSDFGGFTADDRAYDMIYSATVSGSDISALKEVGACTAVNTSTKTITVAENSTIVTGMLPGDDYTPTIDLKDITTIGIGVCSAVDKSSASITYPSAGDYIFFAKSKSVQNNGLLGYYMQVKMTLTPGSSKKTELFAVGSEVFESSK
tara:strand:- start:1872 stop:2369 length:498 start_codon:yes stop_codon:yes gene_type:complete